MKIKIAIMLFFVSLVFGLTLNLQPGKLNEVTGLTLANALTDEAILDSMNAKLTLHYAKTASHEYADETTTVPTASNASALPQAITDANAVRTSMLAHFALDSCHNGGADITVSIPGALSTNASEEAYNTYINALNVAMTSHRANTISTRYNYLGKITMAAFIAHCAKDTSDVDSVHWVPDETYNTVTYDSTNIDSSIASWNRLKGRFNSHIQFATGDGSEPHKEYTNLDSITSADATNYATLYALANEVKAKYNLHAARSYTVEVDSVHFKADAGVVSTADVTVGGGHIAADATTFTQRRHGGYSIPYRTDRITVQFTGTGITTGASFRCYGSIDPDLYGWVYIDSTATLTAGTFKHYNTNFYPYMKWYMSQRTDGTWKIGITPEER
jgi:hypothetical protein